MVSPALMNGYNVAASLAGAEGTDPMKYWNLFGLQVQQAGYQGTVLPIMLVAFILSHIEKFFHKVLKGTIDFIFTPHSDHPYYRLPDLPAGRPPDVPAGHLARRGH